MMRKIAKLLIFCVLILPAAAQRGGGGFHGGMGGLRGGGYHGGGFVGSGFRGGYGGFRGYRGYYPGGRFVFGFGFPYYWPYYAGDWGYPYYYSYPYYPYWAYPQPYVYGYPYYYSYGYVNGGPDPSSCPQTNGKPLYLIKLTNANTPWVAQDYWYAADTLNFITAHGEQNKTPIASIDRAATYQMNRPCGINFEFPR
jgi:hypothetical protein